jgi:hypothetical protein
VAKRGFDIKAVARTINRRREEYNRRHPEKPVPITPSLSRILENDDDYVPYRNRSRSKQRRPAMNPGIATLVEIADALGTTVGDLLGERPYRISSEDRRRIRDFVRWLSALLDLESLDNDERRSSKR